MGSRPISPPWLSLASFVKVKSEVETTLELFLGGFVSFIRRLLLFFLTLCFLVKVNQFSEELFRDSSKGASGSL